MPEGSAVTWSDSQGTPKTYAWIPYGQVTDLWGGVDFVPKAGEEAPYQASTDRPAVVWNLSVITASNFSAEGRP